MYSILQLLGAFLLASVLYGVYYVVYHTFIAPLFDPLRKLSGPPNRGFFSVAYALIIDPVSSPKAHQVYTKRYGRNICVRGLGPWDERLVTLDPVSISHVLKNSNTIYQKPWPTRRMITSFVGCGMLSAEGIVHKRQRRVATPAFSNQNLRELVPLVFRKGGQLRDRWQELVQDQGGDENKKVVRLDVYYWLIRATFDVIGSAGFDYEFNAIQDESNELFKAYKEMFEMTTSQGQSKRFGLGIYFPIVNVLFPNHITRTVARCREVIYRIAGQLIQEKKRKIDDGEKSGEPYQGKDLLSLLLKSNIATDLPPSQRISDEDILHNINTFMFAGSDTSSLAVTWTLLLLAQKPSLQSRLRSELLRALPLLPNCGAYSALSFDDASDMHTTLTGLPFLHNVVREGLRLVPPVHSTLRVAMEDDLIPTSSAYPVKMRDGTERPGGTPVEIRKGSSVHVAIEGFNLDQEVWGEDAWEFNPDRWDDLPEKVLDQPGVYSHLLSFSAGPRSCIGMRFSLIEIKVFLYILLTNFVFAEAGEKIVRCNVVFTRPFVSGKKNEGSQCPLLVSPYIPEDAL